MKEQLLKKLHDEITALDRELKLELPLEIKRARELGDLRENAEYHAAKERQTYVQARISMLQKRVSDVQLINLDKIPHGKAAFGSTVHLREDTGSDVVFQLVMPEDADVDKGMISTSSPIGRAIVGKQAGDEVLVVTPNGKRSFEITKLLTVHDLA
jgi:transcription elongation factor GreA